MASGEQTNPAGHNLVPRDYAEQLLQTYNGILLEAATVAYPNRVGEPFTDVFPQPAQPRDQATQPLWNEEQQQRMRELVSNFGVGRENDRPISELGLTGRTVAIIEGGQPHKIQAELVTALTDS